MLVELKQPAPKVELFKTVGRHTLGDLELITLSDGFFGLDGGAMFGVVPQNAVGKAPAAGRCEPHSARHAAADCPQRRRTR